MFQIYLINFQFDLWLIWLTFSHAPSWFILSHFALQVTTSLCTLITTKCTFTTLATSHSWHEICCTSKNMVSLLFPQILPLLIITTTRFQFGMPDARCSIFALIRNLPQKNLCLGTLVKLDTLLLRQFCIHLCYSILVLCDSSEKTPKFGGFTTIFTSF